VTTKAEELLREALSLPVGQRAELAAELLASLDEAEDDPEIVEAEWAEEIRRRVDALEAGEARTEPWEIVRQRIENKLGR
jgi:putative addiction module component (TIGR02574 family)